jgi:asparagine synthase (glutamine-hydrolysing)
MLIITDNAVRVSRYWDVPTPPDPRQVEQVDPTDAQEEVKSLVEESVRLRMIADVPVGCLLSGGLDSSSILGMAARYASKPLAAFTVGFSDDAFDETADAQAMAKHIGAAHHIVRVDERDMAEHFQDAVWHAEMVQYNSHGTARYLLSRGVRAAGYKTVLAGEGADEIFFGYQFTRAAARVQSMTTFGRLRAFCRLLRPKRYRSEGLSATSPWLARLTTLLDISPDLLERLTGALDRLRRVQSRSYLESFDGFDVYRAFYQRCDAQAGISKRAPAHQLTYLWLHSLFSGYHLAADRLDMSHGVEVRLPFLDHVLVEGVSRLPLSLLACQPREKALLRDALGAYLPEFVHARPKRPFWAPPAAARSCNSVHDLIQDTLRGPHARALPFFDHTAIRDLADGVHAAEPQERASLDSLVMAVASLAVLQEGYGLGSRMPEHQAVSVA